MWKSNLAILPSGFLGFDNRVTRIQYHDAHDLLTFLRADTNLNYVRLDMYTLGEYKPVFQHFYKLQEAFTKVLRYGEQLSHLLSFIHVQFGCNPGATRNYMHGSNGFYGLLDPFIADSMDYRPPDCLTNT